MPRGMFGIIERSGRLRSNTAIDLRLPVPACRLRLHTGLTKEPRLRREYTNNYFFHKPKGSLPVAKRFAVSSCRVDFLNQVPQDCHGEAVIPWLTGFGGSMPTSPVCHER